MSAARRQIYVVSPLVLLVSMCLAETQTQTPTPAQATTEAKPSHPKHSRHKPTPPPQLVLPPLSNSPLPQMPMDLLPAAPPKVGFQGGLLTIVAQNSTLSDILRDVHKLTGAEIDIPPNANERVVTRLGPGAPRDVLATLLNGSSFNYVMLGSDSDPSAVASVVLTAKASSNPPGTANANPGQQAYVSQPQPFVAQQVVPQPAGVVQPQPGDDNANGEEADAAADENADQDQSEADPNAAAQQEQQQQQQQQQPVAPNAGPKTPEQILEMLRRQQQPPGAANPQQPPEN